MTHEDNTLPEAVNGKGLPRFPLVRKGQAAYDLNNQFVFGCASSSLFSEDETLDWLISVANEASKPKEDTE